MKFLILLILSLWTAVANAQNRTQPVQMGPLTNCNATAINAAVDCEVRVLSSGLDGVEGFNFVTFEIFYDYAAGTGYTFTLQGCREGKGVDNCTDATDWYTVAGEAFNATTGVLTIYPATVTRVVGADDYLSWSIGTNYRRLRLHNVVATGSPTTSDKITVVARVTYTPAF